MYFKVKVVTPNQYAAWIAGFYDTNAAQAASKATSQQTSSLVPSKPTASSGAN
jgi:heme/copper-type cytochrome/quinol oxidase subunit 2